jgi:hypothetical protein
VVRLPENIYLFFSFFFLKRLAHELLEPHLLLQLHAVEVAGVSICKFVPVTQVK